MEAEAVQMAENGKFEEALELLNKAVDTAPKRASVYNNRAHVYQFQKRFSGKYIYSIQVFLTIKLP